MLNSKGYRIILPKKKPTLTTKSRVPQARDTTITETTSKNYSSRQSFMQGAEKRDSAGNIIRQSQHSHLFHNIPKLNIARKTYQRFGSN